MKQSSIFFVSGKWKWPNKINYLYDDKFCQYSYKGHRTIFIKGQF